jgi:hypothetical protein
MSSGYISAALLIFSLMNISCKQNGNSNSTEKIPTGISLDIGNGITPIDVSPPDIIYFPAGYPLLKMKTGKPDKPVARIIYSRPHKKGRNLFGSDSKSLCPYGKPWRLGANEATELELFREASIDSKLLPAGRYSLYCIPDSLSWTIAINGNIHNWGLDMDSSRDILRTKVPVVITDQQAEDFTMFFREIPGGMELVICWDNIKTSLPFSLP